VTVKEFEKFAREHLLPLDGFVVERELVLEPPVGFLLRAFAFQPAQNTRDTFYVNAVVQPLYVPAQHVEALLSVRSPRWKRGHDDDAVKRHLVGEPLALLRRVSTLREFIDAVEKSEDLEEDAVRREPVAYARLLSGDRGAGDELEALERHAQAQAEEDADLWADTYEVPPAAEVLARVREVRTALDRSRSVAVEILDGWRHSTARSLGIERHLAPLEDAR
jgi:hypothetical protein